MYILTKKNSSPMGETNLKKGLIVLLVLLQVLLATFSLAAAPGRYQVVSGTNDNAYLVDTSTGFVWILTHRTLATGREPVAIPYKFIGITPQSQGNFLLESASVINEGAKDSK